MNIQQANKLVLMIFDGPADETVDVSSVPDCNLKELMAFLTAEGYVDKDEYGVIFTDKGYAVLSKINDGTNVDKLSTFGELKKLAEKFHGQRHKVGNIA